MAWWWRCFVLFRPHRTGSGSWHRLCFTFRFAQQMSSSKLDDSVTSRCSTRFLQIPLESTNCSKQCSQAPAHFRPQGLILVAPVCLHEFRSGAWQVFPDSQTCAECLFANSRIFVDCTAARYAIAAETILFAFWSCDTHLLAFWTNLRKVLFPLASAQNYATESIVSS